MEYLVFRLYGPMASWGEIAVGEARHSAAYPSKSAITGLLASALGLTREQEYEQSQLANGYRQAVKVLNGGALLKDYHTAQAPDSVGKFTYRTRRDEIVTGKERLGTVLSSREYRTDAHAIIAIAADASAPYGLTALAEALTKPKFHLYLGRKACPLAAPLNAKVVSADNYRKALDDYDVLPLLSASTYGLSDERWLPSAKNVRYYWEGELDDFSDADDFTVQHVQAHSRYDKPTSRTRWQFEPRTEYFWQCKNTCPQEVS